MMHNHANVFGKVPHVKRSSALLPLLEHSLDHFSGNLGLDVAAAAALFSLLLLLETVLLHRPANITIEVLGAVLRFDSA